MEVRMKDHNIVKASLHLRSHEKKKKNKETWFDDLQVSSGLRFDGSVRNFALHSR